MIYWHQTSALLFADVVKTEPQEEENARLPDFDLLEDSYDGALVIAEDEDINTLTKEEKVKLRVQQRLLNAERRLMPNATEIDLAEQSEVNAELDRRISDMIVRQDGGWVCTVCGKQANHKSKLKQHAETHLQGYSHPCIMCGKTYRSRYITTCQHNVSKFIILMLDKTLGSMSTASLSAAQDKKGQSPEDSSHTPII